MTTVLFRHRKQDVHTIVTLTDNAPQGLNESLSSFPHATKVSPPLLLSALQGTIVFFFWKLGLFCSSTPFVTGRPYTLIHNGSVHSTGAVGIALSAGPRPALQTAYPGLRAITPPLKVTAYVSLWFPPSSHGFFLSGTVKQSSFPVGPRVISSTSWIVGIALLISAIEESALVGKAAKDDEFYLGVLRDGDDELRQVHHITSGGPSRGTMALETETAPGEGTSVQVRRL